MTKGEIYSTFVTVQHESALNVLSISRTVTIADQLTFSVQKVVCNIPRDDDADENPTSTERSTVCEACQLHIAYEAPYSSAEHFF